MASALVKAAQHRSDPAVRSKRQRAWRNIKSEPAENCNSSGRATTDPDNSVATWNSFRSRPR
jgi:hypothetical protein